MGDNYKIQQYLQKITQWGGSTATDDKPSIPDVIKYFEQFGENGDDDTIYTEQIMVRYYECKVVTSTYTKTLEPEDERNENSEVHFDIAKQGEKILEEKTFKQFFYANLDQLNPQKPYLHYKFMILMLMSENLKSTEHWTLLVGGLKDLYNNNFGLEIHKTCEDLIRTCFSVDTREFRRHPPNMEHDLNPFGRFFIDFYFPTIEDIFTQKIVWFYSDKVVFSQNDESYERIIHIQSNISFIKKTFIKTQVPREPAALRWNHTTDEEANFKRQHTERNKIISANDDNIYILKRISNHVYMSGKSPVASEGEIVNLNVVYTIIMYAYPGKAKIQIPIKIDWRTFNKLTEIFKINIKWIKQLFPSIDGVLNYIKQKKMTSDIEKLVDAIEYIKNVIEHYIINYTEQFIKCQEKPKVSECSENSPGHTMDDIFKLGINKYGDLKGVIKKMGCKPMLGEISNECKIILGKDFETTKQGCGKTLLKKTKPDCIYGSDNYTHPTTSGGYYTVSHTRNNRKSRNTRNTRNTRKTRNSRKNIYN